ncbi:MAG: hypothetical protein MZW92_69610 [Comamonadaceae bacterium]|nr:hypothetical protein [Comamonadaceae bacterium]
MLYHVKEEEGELFCPRKRQARLGDRRDDAAPRGTAGRGHGRGLRCSPPVADRRPDGGRLPANGVAESGAATSRKI